MDDFYYYYSPRVVADGRTRAKTLARGNSKLGADYLNALQRGRALAYQRGDTRTGNALELLYRELAAPEN